MYDLILSMLTNAETLSILIAGFFPTLLLIIFGTFYLQRSKKREAGAMLVADTYKICLWKLAHMAATMNGMNEEQQKIFQEQNLVELQEMVIMLKFVGTPSIIRWLLKYSNTAVSEKQLNELISIINKELGLTSFLFMLRIRIANFLLWVTKWISPGANK